MHKIFIESFSTTIVAHSVIITKIFVYPDLAGVYKIFTIPLTKTNTHVRGSDDDANAERESAG